MESKGSKKSYSGKGVPTHVETIRRSEESYNTSEPEVVLRRSESSFKPSITNRATVVSRTSSGSFPGGTLSRYEMRQSNIGIPLGQVVEISSQGVSNFKEERSHEKAEMQDLNNRLANYMEKMRYFEAMNKALEKEIEKLKKGKDVDFEKIKAMYDDELKAARKLIEDLSREKADADVKNLSLEEDLSNLRNELDIERNHKEDYKNRAEKLADQLGDYEAEIANNRYRVAALEDDVEKLQETVKRLQAENARLRCDLDTETVAHINESNRAQGLEEELNFITQVYEQEIKELQELARRDTTIEMRDFWKGEMGNALRDIQAEYDSRLNQLTNTLESKYNAQLTQVSASINRDSMELNYLKEENKKLRDKLADLSRKLSDLEANNAALDARNKQLEQALREREEELENERDKHNNELAKSRRETENFWTEVQMLTDAKLSLEMEIAAYRKLLESEESRFDVKSRFEGLAGYSTSGEEKLAQVIQHKGSYGGQSGEQQGQKSDFPGRLTINRTSRGGVTFADITPDGKTITIANNSTGFRKREFQLKNWTIERKFKDGTATILYTFKDDIELKPEESITLYSRIAKHNCENDDEIDCSDEVTSWGKGQADTVLRDENNAEKASHKQTFSV